MRSAISFLLIVAAAQLSCFTVEAFSMLQATRVIAPSKAKQARAAPAEAKKPAAKKLVKVTGKTDTKAKSKAKRKAATVSASKAKATTSAKAKAELKAKTKAKAEAKLKANAAVRAKNKAVEAAKAKASAQAKAKALEKAKKVAAFKKKNIRTTTSATAAQVGNSGTDAALAITKNFKPKKDKTKRPLFPGLQASIKKPSSAFVKKDDTPAKANTVLAKKANSPSSASGAVNPIEFGIQVVQSEKGQEAASILIDGGLKLVEAILAEGKKTKVVIPRGFDTGTGDLKKPRVENIGYKQLLDAGIFAGTEFFDVATKNYEKFYIGGEGKEQVKVTRTEAKIDKKTGKILTPVKENYFVNVGGERVLINRRL
jgi:hypothetical protein